MDHVSENAAMRWSSILMVENFESVKELIISAHMAMYNERPPNDGHRKNILNPWHTHVGLGFSLEPISVGDIAPNAIPSTPLRKRIFRSLSGVEGCYLVPTEIGT